MISHPKKRAFITAYRRSGSIVRAAKAAGITRRTHNLWLVKDQAYAGEFEGAKDEWVERLEAEAARRAVDGVPRQRFYKGKPIVNPRTGKPVVEREYSDTLLIFLLKAMRPEKYRERYEQRHVGEVTQRIVFDLLPPPSG